MLSTVQFMAEESAGRTGSMDKPPPPPEGPLIRLVRLGARMSAQQGANAAGISKARWSQVENGYEKKPDGLYYPVHATDGLLARMALAVGLEADRLESEGRRPDAAAVLREMERRDGGRRHGDEPELECEYERRISRSDVISEDQKRLMILAHRDEGHSPWCRPGTEESAPVAAAQLRA